jgi:formylglycine-generating enzyme required for sulfatase activity
MIFLVSCQNSPDNKNKSKQIKEMSTNELPKCCENQQLNLKNEQDSLNIFLLKQNSIDSSTLDPSIYNQMVLIEGKVYQMGADNSNQALDREFPKHLVKVNSFLMDKHEVTNNQFSAFVDSTGYKTVAEKIIDWDILKKQFPKNTPKPGDEVFLPGSLVFIAPNDINNTVDYSQWWFWIKGANWKHPFGPKSDISARGNYPVVHITYTDAVNYANWCGKRLPTEAEWELAARGGLENKMYPWGDEFLENGIPVCNFWSGDFPTKNTIEDGFEGIAPVMKFPPNGLGLYDMAGNVWEICSDWYGENYYKSFSIDEISDNPKGPKTWQYSKEPLDPKRVMRGGSFLCNDSYCSSYRVSARMPNSHDTGTNHTGFRCVKDI